MNGKVVRLRPKGAEAEMDSDVDSLVETDRFEIYRVVDGNETVVGKFYPKRSYGPNLINLNVAGTRPDQPEYPEMRASFIVTQIQLDDLVRKL